jgi:coiled-coil domain-containing protein 12
MSSSHTTLDAAATERKARLAKLKSLKRKQPSEEEEQREELTEETTIDNKPSVTEKYLSGRNYDVSTQGPKLGFESAPSANQDTLEIRAKQITENTSKAAEEEQPDQPIDLFKLQPKKPNWDLKRDLARKLEPLNVQTDNAIARLVRERIEAQKKKQKEKSNGGTEEELLGLQGKELVEGIHQREREEAEDEKNEVEDDL